MGCSNSQEMPLHLAAIRKSELINLCLAYDNLSLISEQSLKFEHSKTFRPSQKLALRTLLRYMNLIAFRAIYLSFKYWKKKKLFLVSISNITTNTFNFIDDTYSVILGKDEKFNQPRRDFDWEIMKKPVTSIYILEIIKHEMVTEYKNTIDIEVIDAEEKILEFQLGVKQIVMPEMLHGDHHAVLLSKTANELDYKSFEGVKAVVSDTEVVRAAIAYNHKATVNSLLLEELNSDAPAEVDLNLTKILRLLEDLMDKKYELDRKELKACITPRDLSEFLVDYLNRSFGIKTVAKKMLQKLMKSLKIYANHPYISLYCRLFRINTDRPVSTNVLIFLAKIRKDFNKLIEFKKKKLNHRSIFFESPDQGGTATLISIFDYLFKSFNEKQCLSLLLQKLCPKTISQVEYLLFYACYRLSKAPLPKFSLNNLSKLQILEIIMNTIDFDMSLLQRKTLGDYVLEQDVKKLSICLSTNTYQENSLNSRYFLSKCEFLTAVLEAYDEVKENYLYLILAAHDKFKPVTPENLIPMLELIDKSLSPETIQEIHSSAFSTSHPHEMDLNAVIFCLIHSGSGWLKDFHIPLFNQAKNPRRIDYADLCIKPQDAIDLRSPLKKSFTSLPKP